VANNKGRRLQLGKPQIPLMIIIPIIMLILTAIFIAGFTELIRTYITPGVRLGFVIGLSLFWLLAAAATLGLIIMPGEDEPEE